MRIKSYYQIKKLAASLLKNDSKQALDLTALEKLLQHYYDRTYRYWLQEDDPQPWFEKEAEKVARRDVLKGIFGPVSHARIPILKAPIMMTRITATMVMDISNSIRVEPLSGLRFMVIPKLPQRLFFPSG